LHTSTLTRQVLATCLIICSALLSGCGTLGAQLDTYKLGREPKAFAVGYLPNGNWVAGWAYAAPSVDRAKEIALKYCEEQVARRGASSACRVMYENNAFVPPSTAQAGSQTPPTDSKSPPRTSQQPSPTVSTGSGVFISADGFVLTAEHVVRNAASIEVLTQDGRRLEARVASASRSLDLAVLSTGARVEAFLPVRMARPTPGARVFTVGFPVPGVLGQEPKVADGIVNAASGIRDDAGFMQISIPIQPGNSGGPVVTEDGTLVGVVSSSAAIAPFLERTGTIPQNVNWATHSSLAITLVGREGPATLLRAREESIAHTIRAAALIVAQAKRQ